MLSYLENTYKNVDRSKIYISGTSYGGYATAYEVLRNPDKYAGAVCAMGFTYNEKFPLPDEGQTNEFTRNLTEEDFESLAKTPFCLAWAKNDHPSISDGSAFLAEKLKSHGGTVKTEVYESGGHTIYSDFFKNKDWAEWIFTKQKTND